MVKKIKLEELADIARNNRITVVLIYNKLKKLCRQQEKELNTIEKKLVSHGVKFVKLDRAKDNLQKELGVDAVPTILMWVRDGIQVAYQFEPEGKIYMQINGFMTADKLLKQIAILLNSYT